MKTSTFVLVVVLGTCLSACEFDSVPNIQDPNNVVVNGEPMTQRAFIEKYCVGKPLNETCIKVQRAGSISNLKSKNGVPRF
jgi:hypothetical protein